MKANEQANKSRHKHIINEKRIWDRHTQGTNNSQSATSQFNAWTHVRICFWVFIRERERVSMQRNSFISQLPEDKHADSVWFLPFGGFVGMVACIHITQIYCAQCASWIATTHTWKSMHFFRCIVFFCI